VLLWCDACMQRSGAPYRAESARAGSGRSANVPARIRQRIMGCVVCGWCGCVGCVGVWVCGAWVRERGLSENFAVTIHAAFGERGDRWLGGWPGTLQELARRWGLTVGRSCSPYLSLNRRAPVLRAAGTEGPSRRRGPSPGADTETTALGALGCSRLSPLWRRTSERGVCCWSGCGRAPC